MGVGDLSLTPILNFKGERLQARTGPIYSPLPPPFSRTNTIFKSTVITKRICWVLIVAAMGIRIKGELMGVGDLSLTPILNFEGERSWLEPVPHYSYYKTNPTTLQSNHKPMVCIILFLNIVFMHKETGACL